MDFWVSKKYGLHYKSSVNKKYKTYDIETVRLVKMFDGEADSL